MLRRCNLKILDIDHDGNTIAEIQKSNKKNEIIKFIFNKNNIDFKNGDKVSALIKRKKRK